MRRFRQQLLDPTVPETLRKELTRIESALRLLAEGRTDVQHEAPDKPREGQFAFADGTDWNPGSGQGFYWFDGAAWQPFTAASGVFSSVQIFDPLVIQVFA